MLTTTGNVQIDEKYLGGPGDLAFGESIAEADVKDKWRKYAAACQVEGTPSIVQVCHPGRQSMLGSGKRGFWEKNIAPSAIPLNIGSNLIACLARSLIFGTPKEMTLQEVRSLVTSYVGAAKFLHETGFSGIELHGAHGYLLGMYSEAVESILRINE
jgi:2,4-dienoyl-CoA reductase-like NADH-dependent reductase (Old Yellow Enzyme family)